MVTIETLSSIINQLLPEPQAGLLSGILFGTKATLTTELKDALITTGTLHLIALSGTNITILTKIVNSVFLSFTSRKVAGFFSMVTIVGFVFFVGPSPSIVRAALMGCISILGVMTGKNRIGIVTWAVAAICMLTVSPTLITNLSFQLSALASLGMVLFDSSSKPPSFGEKREGEGIDAPKHELLEKGAPRLFFSPILSFLYSELRTTLAAQVFTIPLIFITFYRISIISPLTNILVGWSIPFVMILGFVMILCGAVWLPLGQCVSWIVWIFLTYILQCIDLTAQIPYSSIGL